MSKVRIKIRGVNFSATFSNDWDECEANDWLHIEDLDGWYGATSAGIVPDVSRFRTHGKFPGRTIRGHRDITLTLSWFNHRNSAQDYRVFSRFASGIAWDEGPYTMTVEDGGTPLSSTVYLAGDIQHQAIDKTSEQAFRVLIPLRAQDPFLYGDKRQYLIRPAGAEPMVQKQFFNPKVLNPEGKQVFLWGATTPKTPPVVNYGNATSYPVTKVYADSIAGCTLQMYGKSVVYRGALLRNSPLTIDSRGMVFMNGLEQSANLVQRGWSGIAPGSMVTPRVYFPSGGSGYAEMTVTDTYI